MSSDIDSALRQPIIIIGAPRSGTSFLFNVLSVHRDLAPQEEPRMVWRYGNDAKSDLLTADDARPKVRQHIRRYFAQCVIDAGKPRLLEKTPSNALRVPFVDRVFPDAKFVHIHRNGLDSALSIRGFWEGHATGMGGHAPVRVTQRLRELGPWRVPRYAIEFIRRAVPRPLSPLFGRNVWGPRIPGIRRLMRDLELIEVCALQWRTCVECAHRDILALPEDRRLEVRLADMSADLLTRIMRFCELEDDPAVREEFHRLFEPKLASAPRKASDPREVEQVLKWIEPTMRWLEYD